MKKLAIEFGLLFDAGPNKWTFDYPGSYKKNILSGKILGHKIEIYDLFRQEEPRSFTISSHSDYFRRFTVISIDEVPELIPGLLLWFPRVNSSSFASDASKI